MVTVSRATASDNIWETIYDIINTNVTDPNPPSDGSARKWIFSTFPDVPIQSTEGVVSKAKSLSYPMITVEAPEVDWEKLTFRKRWYATQLEISIHSTSKIQSIQLGDSVLEALETNRPALRLLKLVRFEVVAMDNDVDFRGEIKTHRRDLMIKIYFSFKGTL